MKKVITFLLLCMALPLAAQNYKALAEKALQYVEKDSLVQAEKLFKEAIKANQDEKETVALYCNLGLIQRQMKHYSDATDSYTMALRAEPKSTAILLKRALIYMEEGLEATALTDYNQALALQPDNKEALTVRAFLHSKRGEIDDARADYNHLKSTMSTLRLPVQPY